MEKQFSRHAVCLKMGFLLNWPISVGIELMRLMRLGLGSFQKQLCSSMKIILKTIL